ncbi:MAG: SsrA-binding protein [Bacteroidia bacterium]|jgi:SsrA-binding protein
MEIITKNRKASHEFTFLDKFTAGVKLTGTEIKSIRVKDVNLNDAFCSFTGDELYIRNMHIGIYGHGTVWNHEPKAERKLLLNRSELKKLQNKLKDQGLTIVPLKMFISNSGFAKIDIALAKGKKLYDKREDMKMKDQKRDMERND